MRILAVVYCFPPLLVPAAMCYLKLVLGLRARGAEVEVLGIDPRSFMAPGPGLLDESLTRLVPDDLVQHRVRSPETHPAVRLAKRLIGTTPLGIRWFEPRKREWTGPGFRRLRRLDPSRYDVILTCSQPHANHLLGLEMKRRFGRPWVAYFSDPWARNPYARFATPRVAAHHRRLERQVLEAADHVLFTSAEMERLAREDHEDILAGKSGVLPHAFVPDWYGPPKAPARAGPVRVLHTGHFYGPRSPAPLVRALVRLHRRKPLDDRLRLESYGTFPEEETETLRREGLSGVVGVYPVIPYLESLTLMRRHDVLLLVDAKLGRAGESVFLPSKLVDYLGSGTPVLAVTPQPGTTARVVSETGGRVADVEDEAAIEAALEEVVEAGGLPAPDSERVRPYHYEQVADSALRVLGGVIPAA